MLKKHLLVSKVFVEILKLYHDRIITCKKMSKRLMANNAERLSDLWDRKHFLLVGPKIGLQFAQIFVNHITINIMVKYVEINKRA